MPKEISIEITADGNPFPTDPMKSLEEKIAELTETQDEIIVNLSDVPALPDYQRAFKDISNIMTEDVRTVLDMCKERLTRTNWDLGDVSLKLYALVIGNKLPYTKKMVFAFVASYIDSADHGANTIEDYAYVCAGYDLNERKMYRDLPFSHFRLALRYGTKKLEVLDESLEALARYGRPISARKLRSIFDGTAPHIFTPDGFDKDAPLGLTTSHVGNVNTTGNTYPVNVGGNDLESEVTAGQVIELRDILNRLTSVLATMKFKSPRTGQNLGAVVSIIDDIIVDEGLDKYIKKDGR